MEQEEKELITEMETHKKILRTTFDCLTEAEKKVQITIEESKWLGYHLGEAKSNVKRELDFISVIPTEVVSLPKNISSVYPPLVESSRSFKGTAEAFLSDMKSVNVMVSQLTSTASMFPFITASGTMNAITAFSSISHPFIQEKIKEINQKDNIYDNFQTILAELKNLQPDVGSSFREIMVNWEGYTTNKDLRYPLLLNLRSVVFYQLLESLVSQQNYSKTDWYKQGLKGRYCQAKFFMLGFTKRIDLPASTYLLVDTVADSFLTNFGSMSLFGKKGGEDILVEPIFRKMINDFATALRIRKLYYKPHP